MYKNEIQLLIRSKSAPDAQLFDRETPDGGTTAKYNENRLARGEPNRVHATNLKGE